MYFQSVKFLLHLAIAYKLFLIRPDGSLESPELCLHCHSLGKAHVGSSHRRTAFMSPHHDFQRLHLLFIKGFHRPAGAIRCVDFPFETLRVRLTSASVRHAHAILSPSKYTTHPGRRYPDTKFVKPTSLASIGLYWGFHLCHCSARVPGKTDEVFISHR